MIQYFIFALDGTDENAMQRRLEVRPRHFEFMKKVKENGNFISGGAQLNQQGEMIGSAAFLQFENITQLEHYLANEPYIQEGVWKEYKVIPFKVANI
jgi:uncharacterized protein